MDRLRRLDALFAARVLGHTVTVDCPNCERVSYSYYSDNERSHYSGMPLPEYTRSLDAVVNATNQSGECAIKFCCRDIHCDHDYIYKATVAFDNEGHCTFNGRSCDHPAEALVLACLRAVGCTEEELK